ncbi:serine/threonine protein kinase [Microcoleus vaginatus GB1-A2]|uniref:serine/threonine-protein kinase n=1 Tax=Microcoleus vaginatus TaxID=119532 RepID=UPI001688244D|nr:protein kinase [Microcoleus sp. FACHB-61]
MTENHIHNIGDRVDNRYEILRFVGEGGMQQVYRARDLVLGREVALKLPKNSSAQKRFKRSAVVSAKVNHPNVAKTLDYLETDSSPYLVEEFISGKDLKEGLLQQLGIVDPYLTAKILHYLAKGVAASHNAGVIHRDLKPSNVMFSGDFNLSEIKITDFGIAKMAEEEIVNGVKDESSISASTTVMGALPYMAPEMIEEASKAGKPSDIWAVGAMIYELMSGQKPFGSGLVAVRTILKAIPPQKPAYIDKNLQFQSLGNELYTLILECLNKNPEARPTADELVQRCEKLCYPVVERQIGICKSLHSNYDWGLIQSDGGDTIFFHFDSVYGNKPTVGSRVCFSAFPGSPHPRAHPVVLIEGVNTNP